jgi:hypothetical protein
MDDARLAAWPAPLWRPLAGAALSAGTTASARRQQGVRLFGSYGNQPQRCLERLPGLARLTPAIVCSTPHTDAVSSSPYPIERAAE